MIFMTATHKWRSYNLSHKVVIISSLWVNFKLWISWIPCDIKLLHNRTVLKMILINGKRVLQIHLFIKCYTVSQTAQGQFGINLDFSIVHLLHYKPWTCILELKGLRCRRMTCLFDLLLCTFILGIFWQHIGFVSKLVHWIPHIIHF